jgi:3-oxoacyl-[acyl-carrier protein] reductase
MDIKDSRILITGAGAGFGRAMALYFSNIGAKVFAFDIDQTALNNLKSKCNEIYTTRCDVSDPTEVELCVKDIFEIAGGLEVLINNAGIMKNAPLINFLNRTDRKHSLELWDKVIAINQSAVFYMTRACADLMISKRCKGAIVNISSISAKGNIGQTAYSASKAAVEAMTKVWAKELGLFGIRSVSIAPGFIDTAGTSEAIEEKMLAQWIEKTPLRRTGTIHEIVKSVQFAIENDFVNGETISVNGGLTL